MILCSSVVIEFLSLMQNTMSTARRYSLTSIHFTQANLYQIFTYVKNKEYELREKDHTVSGMLLYAKTDEEIYPNNVYQMSGNQITVRTLDLNLPFAEIAEQLDTIAKSHFEFIKEASYLKKKKDEITIRSSAAEYLTYVASIGDQQDSIEMRYEDENIWLTQKMMATLYDVGVAYDK